MSTGSKKRTRSERVASVELPPGSVGQSAHSSAARACAGAAGDVCGGGDRAVGDHAGLGAAAAVSFGRHSAARRHGPHAVREVRREGDGRGARAGPQAGRRRVRPGSDAARAVAGEARERRQPVGGGGRFGDGRAAVERIRAAAGRRYARSRPRKSVSSSSNDSARRSRRKGRSTRSRRRWPNR